MTITRGEPARPAISATGPSDGRSDSNRNPLLQATLLLLQERIPGNGVLSAHCEFSDIKPASGAPETPIRVFSSPDRPYPQVQLLSNEDTT